MINVWLKGDPEECLGGRLPIFFPLVFVTYIGNGRGRPAPTDWWDWPHELFFLDASCLLLSYELLLYVNGIVVQVASETSGDFVEDLCGVCVGIAHVTVVLENGLFNPQTLHGAVLVSTVREKTFNNWIDWVGESPCSPFFGSLSLTTCLARKCTSSSGYVTQTVNVLL